MIYLLFCFISLFMGLGVQRLLQLKLSSALSLTLAPILSLSVYSLLLGWEVKLGHHPLKDFYLFNWSIVFLCALLGLTKNNFYSIKENLGLLATCFLLPVALMFNYFWFGLLNYPGSTVADGWSYIAVGEYLWEYPRGTEENLNPLFQYATSFNSTRFITSAILASLSPFDIQMVTNAYIAWTFFIFSCSCAFFVLTQSIGKYIYPYLILTVFSGWFILLLKNNNFDHAAFLGFLPIIASGFILFNHQRKTECILLSVIIAASLYIYPEMSPPIALGVLLFFIAASFKNKKVHLPGALITVTLILLLLSPYLKEFIAFFLKQSNQLNAPHEMRSCPSFNPAMLMPSKMLVSFWGQRHNILGNITALICTLLFFRGLYLLYKEKNYIFLIFMAILMAGAAIMIFKYQYSYGAFKLISITWWLIIFAVIAGAKSLLSSHPIKNLKGILSVIFVAYLVSGICSIYSMIQKPGLDDFSPLRAVRSIKTITGNAAILVNINDDVINEWTMYFLKDFKIQVVRPPRFMTGTNGMQFMEKVVSIDPTNIHYILTDNASSDSKNHLIWSNGLYYLWKKT